MLHNKAVVRSDPWGQVNWVRFRHYDVNGNLKNQWVERNNRINMGALWEMNTLFGTVDANVIATTIALTGTIYTPTTDATTLVGQIATYGFERIGGTRQNYVAPTGLNGTYTIDVFHQFQHTGTGTAVGIGMAGLFAGTFSGTAGTLYALATFSQGPATLQLAEKLDVTWTVSH